MLVVGPQGNAVHTAARPEAVSRDTAWSSHAGAWSSADAGSPALVVGLPGGVDPAHAPVPRTEAERAVFAQLYQTLVAVDCRGDARPALAASWEVADQGRRWTFHLRPARAWNGARVGAADVARSLSAAGIGALQTLAVVGDRTLSLELSVPVTASFFARPALALAFADSAQGWPIGTGPYRPASFQSRSPTSGPTRTVRLVSRSGGVVEFRTVAGDPRNALDAGVDLLVTRDPATLEYAAASGGYRAAPLPWDRVYLLLAPGDPGQGPVATPPAVDLEALARDAVREQARQASFNAADLERCALSANAERPDAVAVEQPDTAVPGRRDTVRVRTAGAVNLPSRSAGQQIVYPQNDAAAAALAQRLVALARAGNGPAWVPGVGAGALVADGLSVEEFDDALDRGDATAFLFPVRRTAGEHPCDVMGAVERRAPWARASRIVPLVETRATALLRDGVAGLAGVTVDGAGTLHLQPVPPMEPRP